MQKRAFITGITGQDGSYLAELLLSKNYQVHGLVRRSSSIKRERIDHITQRFSETDFRLHYGDMQDDSSISRIIAAVQPDEIYNLAAQSHVKISFETPIGTSDVDGIGTARLLEAMRNHAPQARLYQASTSEMFGSTPPPQSEISRFSPQSPYANAKLFAHGLVRNYREGYGLFAVSGILFNHESPRRGENFVTSKIAAAAVAIAEGKQKRLVLGNLDAVRDWGYAPEYVEGMWRMLQQEEPQDLVLGTGIGHTIREFLDFCFAEVGLDWKHFVGQSQEFYRPTEVDSLIADDSKAREYIDWKPLIFGRGLAKIMVEAEQQKHKLGISMVDPWKFE